jgi:hypothetical protein
MRASEGECGRLDRVGLLRGEDDDDEGREEERLRRNKVPEGLEKPVVAE